MVGYVNLVQPLWKTAWWFLKKRKIRVAIWSGNLSLGHILRQNYNLKRYMHPYVHDSESVSSSVVSSSLQPHGLYSLPGSSVHGTLQARILEWVAISFSGEEGGGLPHTGNKLGSPALRADSLPSEPPGSTIYNSKVRETTYESINRWMDKEDVEYTYMNIWNGILLSH